MMQNITHDETRVQLSDVQLSDTYAGKLVNSVKRNFGRCLAAIRSAEPEATKRSELMLVLAMPFLAVSTAILPMVLPMPATRLFCASILAVVLLTFVGRRLEIVQSMSQAQTYKLTSALIATFLFGLVAAVVWGECVTLFTHY